MTIQVYKSIIVQDLNNNFKIDYPLRDSIVLNHQVFDYYLKLLSVNFSLVDPNVFESVNDTFIFRIENSITHAYINVNYTFSEGLYDLADLVDIFNEQFLVTGTETYYCKLIFNQYTGKLSLKSYPDVLNASGFDTILFTLSRDQNFMQNKILGFTQWTGLTGDVITLNSVTPSIAAAGQPIIQSYNNLILSTNLTKSGGLTLNRAQSNIVPSNVIMAVSSSGAPYSLLRNVSFVDLLFPIDVQQLDSIVFELRGENNEILNVSGDNTTDFMVQAAILYKRK